jgi:hypothetical protein
MPLEEKRVEAIVAGVDPMIISNLVAGALLLLFGRRLFWLFVAVVGFVAGARLAIDWLDLKAQWMVLVAGCACGLAGALFSVFLQRVVVTLAGFLAGGSLLCALVTGEHFDVARWLAFVLGGVAGALLVITLFDWALIVLSCLCGALLISNTSLVAPAASKLLFLVLLVVGLGVQTRQLLGNPRVTQDRSK